MDTKPDIYKSRRLPRQQKGGVPIMLRRAVANLVMQVCESFLNLKVYCPQTDGTLKEANIVSTELGTTITLPEFNSETAVSGGSVSQFKIVSDGGDYWNCKTWDGTTLGSTEIKVAKPYKLRAGTGKITSEVIRGVTYTYTYTGVYISGSSGPFKYYTRTAVGSDGITETNYVIPDPIANDIIYAINFSTASPATLSDVTYLDLNVDGRAWAK